MNRKALLAVGVAIAGIITFSSSSNYAYNEEEEGLFYEGGEELYSPFYFPYTAESEHWFQPLYHPYVPKIEKWFNPFLGIREEYDDNIYLARTDKISDWITTLQPGFVIQPRLTPHKFSLDYLADLNFFANYDDENNFNHTLNAALQLNLNKKAHFDVVNMFHYFSDRATSEDTNRIPRTQDYVWPSITFNFNKMDLLLGYNYRFEKYRTDDAIGSFDGQALTYKDLDRNENEGTIETAWKLWPKTALLFTFDYGTIDHNTGKKPNSDYYALLVGLHGEPTAKNIVEARIGFRKQNYEDYSDNFSSLVFDGSWVLKLTSRDSLRFDFERTTNDTIFQDNAYYTSSYIGADFQHGFTERLYGTIAGSYQRNDYPTETTLDDLTDYRKDDFWTFGVGLRYKFSKWIIADIKYEYRTRDSNFSRYEYKNNRINAGLTAYF